MADPIQIVDLKAQYVTIKDEVDAAIQHVLNHQQFILGPEVQAFEKEIADYCGVRFAIGVASGTDALRLAVLACGIGSGDEIITTPFTFVATAETIVQCGAKPVFADIDPKTCNLDPRKIEPRITPRTKAILPVHLYGQSADMKPMLELARRHGLKMIEDCAQALGTEYGGKKVGSLGDAGCLSFFPSKNLGALGDGGMVITNNHMVAEASDALRKHGAKVGYYYDMIGFNTRLDTLQAAVLSVKLKYLYKWLESRRKIGALYDRLLSDVEGIEPLHTESFGLASFNYYTIRVSLPWFNRTELVAFLKSRGIQTAVYYPLSLHLQAAYKYLGYKAGDFPESEKAQEEVISLPMYAELTQTHVESVVAGIRDYASGRTA